MNMQVSTLAYIYIYRYIYIQVNEKSYELKRGNIGWYKKEGDKIGMVWYTMYAWCIRIVYVCMGE